MAAPVPPPPLVIAEDVQVEEAEHDDHDENMRSYSAEFQIEGIRNNRNEEDRLTEAEKNERVQRQLMVRYVIYTQKNCIPAFLHYWNFFKLWPK